MHTMLSALMVSPCLQHEIVPVKALAAAVFKSLQHAYLVLGAFLAGSRVGGENIVACIATNTLFKEKPFRVTNGLGFTALFINDWLALDVKNTIQGDML